jgi:hypothetical protein
LADIGDRRINTEAVNTWWGLHNFVLDMEKRCAGLVSIVRLSNPPTRARNDER